MAKAQVARFYGFSNSEIEQMEYETFAEYLGCIEVLNSRELLESITASTLPHTKPDNQRETHRRIHRQAFPVIWDDAVAKPVTTEQLSRMLNGR